MFGSKVATLKAAKITMKENTIFDSAINVDSSQDVL